MHYANWNYEISAYNKFQLAYDQLIFTYDKLTYYTERLDDGEILMYDVQLEIGRDYETIQEINGTIYKEK